MAGMIFWTWSMKRVKPLAYSMQLPGEAEFERELRDFLGWRFDSNSAAGWRSARLVTKGLEARGEEAWRALANRSMPVLPGPRRSTGTRLGATAIIASINLATSSI